MHAPVKSCWRQNRQSGTLPDHLVSREALRDLRDRLSTEGIVNPTEEPDWAKIRDTAREEHGLNEAHADEMIRALERLWFLPFHRYDTCAPHILFLFTSLPGIESRFRKKRDRQGLLLTKAYRVMAEILLQGCAVCPGEPHHLANQLRQAIESPAIESRVQALPLARLLASSRDGVCGNNRYRSKEPNVIALYENRARYGIFEGAVASAHKFGSYSRNVASSKEFWREWKALKTAFRDYDFWDKYGIVRRTPIPEGNWHRERLPHDRDIRDRFQVAFDVFCWKWFLYGMKRGKPQDKPLVQKIAYAFTPYGTQIFIPGYWSIDLNRDFNWEEIAGLHRARGIQKQGEKLERNRHDKARQVDRLKAAAIEAKREGLRGLRRMNFLKQAAGLSVETDDAYVRRLLRIKGPRS